MTGNELGTLVDEVNGGASIGDTLKFQLLNLAKAMVEQRRPWMILRNTDTSKTVTTANTWQTAIDLSTIARFNRFYGDCPVKLFNGSQTVYEYSQAPFHQRLQYMQRGDTFVYDEAGQDMYLGGTPPFAGTLYIDHIKDSADIEDDDDSAWVFPGWSHPILAFIANGIHKGGIDYDDVNARMAPENRAAAAAVMTALETWDNDKQLAAISSTDPYNDRGGYRSGAIDMHA